MKDEMSVYGGLFERNEEERNRSGMMSTEGNDE